MEQGWVSLTPVRRDPTDQVQLESVRARYSLDEAVAAAISPTTSSPEAARSVREDEAAASIAESVHVKAATRERSS